MDREDAITVARLSAKAASREQMQARVHLEMGTNDADHSLRYGWSAINALLGVIQNIESGEQPDAAICSLELWIADLKACLNANPVH